MSDEEDDLKLNSDSLVYISSHDEAEGKPYDF
jgi:hypothetical protein